MPQVKINPNFGYWTEVSSGSGGGSSKPPTNPLTSINQTIKTFNSANGNAASPVGYHGVVHYTQTVTDYDVNTSATFNLPPLNMSITSITIGVINTSNQYIDITINNNTGTSLWINATTVDQEAESVSTIILTPGMFYVENNQLTFYYNSSGSTPTSGSLSFDVLINYIVTP